MKLSRVSCKLIQEVLRLKTEYKLEYCTVPMLISGLFAVRDGEEFTNLFCVYFEKKLGIKCDVIDKVLDDLIHASVQNTEGETSKETKSVRLQPMDAKASCLGEVSIPVDPELSEIFEHVEEFVNENHGTEVYPDYFSVSLFEVGSKSIRMFLKKISANYMEAENFFSRSKILSYEIIPYEISHFVTFVNPFYEGKTCQIVGREKELTEIYRNMLKPVKRNVLLYGMPGVGKTAVGELLKHSIANGLCPNHFKGFRVFEMSVKDFLLKCEDTKEANELMNTLLNFLTKQEDNIILLIDEIQTIIGKGGLFDAKKMDLSTTLKPILVRGDVRIVGMTTQSDYFSFQADQALNRRFAGIEVKEPKIGEVSAMISPTVREVEQKKGITISSEIIDKAIWYAACFEFDKHNPDKSLDVINGAIANTQLRNATEVTVQDVIDVFDVSFKRWNGMAPEMKRNTAYHEAGHYLVNRLKNPGNFVVLAVSIYPTEEYQGINVLEHDESITPNQNKQYFYDEIAERLAGRIAEKLVSGDVNAGAGSDLDSATEIATEMITEFGMGEGIGRNRVYLMEEYGSDEAAKEVDREVSKIIDHVYAECEKLLKDNRDFLDAIAEALLKNHIMMKEELDLIWNGVQAERDKPKKHPDARRHRGSLSFKKGKRKVFGFRIGAKKLKKFHK